MDRPLRALQPAGPVERPLDLAPVPSQPGRRKHIGVACNPCRQRKSKCDGNKPVCNLCSQKSTKCVYDSHRRKSVDVQAYNKRLERSKKLLEDRMRAVMGVFDHLRQCPSPEAQNILQQIRAGEDIWDVVTEVTGFVQSLDDDDQASVDGDASPQPTMAMSQDGDMTEEHEMAMQMPSEGQMADFVPNVPDSTLHWLHHGNAMMEGLPHLDDSLQFSMYPFNMPGIPAQASGPDILREAARQMRQQQEDDEMGEQG